MTIPERFAKNEVIIIGTGPTGLVAAKALANANVNVVMIDAGLEESSHTDPQRPSLARLRTDGNIPEGERTQHLLGDDLKGLFVGPNVSPKIRLCTPVGSVSAYQKGNDIQSSGFVPIGTEALGGLSNVWGSCSSVWSRHEFPVDFPYDDLCVSYRRLFADMSFCGETQELSANFPNMPLGTIFKGLSDRFVKTRPEFQKSFSVYRPLYAVDTGPSGCNQCAACMWGCPQGAIYNAADDLPALLKRPNVKLLKGYRIDRLQRMEDGYVLTGTSANGSPFRSRATHIILAAGALVTTKLVLGCLEKFAQPIRMENSPAFAAAFIDPARLGIAMDPKTFGMAHLAADMKVNADTSSHVLFYDAGTQSISDLVRYMPFSRIGALSISSALLPAMTLALGYLPGRASLNTVSLNRDHHLHIQGGLNDGSRLYFRQAKQALAKNMRKLGSWMLPGSFSLFDPGAEVHYGSSLYQAGLCTSDGAIKSLPNMYALDSSVLPSLSEKHHTFSAMANADRVARSLIARHDLTQQIGE